MTDTDRWEDEGYQQRIGAAVFDALEAEHGGEGSAIDPAASVALCRVIASITAATKPLSAEDRESIADEFRGIILDRLELIEQHRATIEGGLSGGGQPN